MKFESAADWNGAHGVGTRVSVRKVNGSRFEARTTSLAVQWGSHAYVELDGQAGVWMVSALTAAAGEAQQKNGTT